MKICCISFAFLVSSIGFSSFSNDTISISEDMVLVKISENAYQHIYYTNSEKYGRFPSNGLVYIKDHKAIIMDTPGNDSLSFQLINYLKDSMNLAISGVIVNHYHEDCMGGLNAFHEMGISSYGCILTCKKAKEEKLPIPDICFGDSLIINFSNEVIHCYYPGEAHTPDNIVAYIPKAKILFGGCMIKSMRSKGLGNTKEANIPKWGKTLLKVRNKFPETEIVIPGHGDFGGKELIFHTLDLLPHSGN